MARRVGLISPTYAPDPNGLAVSVRRYAQHLASAGDEVHVLVFRSRPGWKLRDQAIDSDRDGPVRVHQAFLPDDMAALADEMPLSAALQFRASTRGRRGERMVSLIRMMHERVGLDLLHGFEVGPVGLAVALAAKELDSCQSGFAQEGKDFQADVLHGSGSSRSRVPSLVTVAGSDLAEGVHDGIRLPLIEASLRLADFVVFQAADQQRLGNSLAALHGKSAVIADGVDLEAIEASSVEARLMMQRPFVGTMGSLRYVKGLDHLLVAAAEVMAEHKFSLLLVGPVDPDDERAYRAIIEEKNLKDHVYWTGQLGQGQAWGYLKQMDLFVMPSFWEATCTSVLEAMACGLPVIASRVGGMADYLQHETNGLLVPPGQSLPLADALRRLLQDERLRGQLGQAARQTAQEYTIQQTVTAYRKLYERLQETR